jgi:hypothetical protein
METLFALLPTTGNNENSAKNLVTGWVLFSSFVAVLLGSHAMQRQIKADKERLEHELKWYSGACHCFAVNFKLKAPKHLVVWNCNCSICQMKKNHHFIIPRKDFFLSPASEEHLTEYTFNTKQAKHLFCKNCGVQAHYIPRSNPDGIAVTLACIPNDQVCI